MISAHTTTNDYATQKKAAETALLAMKAALDQYKKLPTANATHVEIREKQLLALIRFMEVSEDVIYLLAEERNAAFKRGIQRGQELANTEQEHQVSRHWGRRNLHPDREVNRRYLDYEQMAKWSDHY
ncbi:hypothetical protein [Haliscomenobacter hydrossis]|uniref:Uncharacterized protein n=1 Tax=Haliscomenobacter hydrossis (strain ATCC 27775 / DSM 1100 / LMG 10767 / O) TaxID=760192 RepID=F4L083_HALH1|nr:hypothetical protein [Haliscomenobacter hydrossis]AEE53756.1 hypothetical protein Halhy_5933 [Haliscomenobacter hydrossis DSM 1100]